MFITDVRNEVHHQTLSTISNNITFSELSCCKGLVFTVIAEISGGHESVSDPVNFRTPANMTGLLIIYFLDVDCLQCFYII